MTKRHSASVAKASGLTFDRLIVMVLFIALFAMAVRAPANTDVWWHLGAGRAIIATGHIPYADEFSFTVRGKPWVDVYWLAQAGMYALYHCKGLSKSGPRRTFIACTSSPFCGYCLCCWLPWDSLDGVGIGAT